MKKIFLMLAAAGLMFSSCQKDENLGSSTGETLVTVTTSVPQNVGVRSAMLSTSDKGGVVNVAIDNNIRYILSIYEGDIAKGGTNLTFVKKLDTWTAGTTTSTQVRLIPNHTYTFVAWADFAQSAGSTEDWHYDTSNFPAITEKDARAINDETRDAYFVVKSIVVKENDNVSLTLKRPFGKVRVVTTDWNEDAIQKADVPNKATITYTNTKLYTGMDLLTGALTGENTTMEYTAAINDYTNEGATVAEKTLYVDYLWGVAEQYPIHFDIALAKDNTSIRTFSVKTDVPVTRNWLTTVKGNILTTNTSINIEVDPEFDNEHEFAYTDLELTAINGGEITLAEDVTLNSLNVYADFTLNIADDATYTGGSASNYGIIVHNGTTTINGNDGNIYSKGGAIAVTNGASLIFNSGNLDVNTTSTSGRYLFYLEGAGSTVTINGGNFDWDRSQNQKRAYIYASTGTTVYVKGGTFGKASTRSGYTAGIMGDGDVIITGGTFGFDPSTWVAAGYQAVKSGSNWYVISDDMDVVTNAADLKSVVAAGKTDLYLLDGEYDIDDCGKKTFTIQGSRNVVIKVVGGAQGEAGGQLDYGLDGSTVTFKGVTIRTNGQTYAGYARLNATYIDCAIENCYCLNGTSTFEKCTLSQSGDQYNIWTWGAPEATFTGCTFNCDGKAMLLYGTANTKLTIDTCVFNDNGGLPDLKAAIEIGNDYNKSYELIVNNTTVNGFEINDKGINTGTTLWANKNSMGKDKLNVVVDGVDVY